MSLIDSLNVLECAELRRLLEKGRSRSGLNQFYTQADIVAGILNSFEMEKLAHLAASIGLQVRLVRPASRSQAACPCPSSADMPSGSEEGKVGIAPPSEDTRSHRNKETIWQYPDNVLEAEEIMGDGFLGPKDMPLIMGKSATRCTDIPLLHFTPEYLRLVRHRCVLVCLPPVRTAEIIASQPDSFGRYLRDNSRWLGDWEICSPGMARWYLLEKETFAVRPGVSFDELDQGLTEDTSYPHFFRVAANLNLVLYAAVGLRLLRRESIMEEGWVFCRNTNSAEPRLQIACRYLPKRRSWTVSSCHYQVKTAALTGLAVTATFPIDVFGKRRQIMPEKRYPLRWVHPEKPITKEEGRDMFVINLHDHIMAGQTWGSHSNLSGDASGLIGDVGRLTGEVDRSLFGFTGSYDQILEGDVTGLTGPIEQYIDPDSDDGHSEIAEHFSGSGVWLDPNEDDR